MPASQKRDAAREGVGGRGGCPSWASTSLPDLAYRIFLFGVFWRDVRNFRLQLPGAGLPTETLEFGVVAVDRYMPKGRKVGFSFRQLAAVRPCQPQAGE
jgi:hypothetical protein